MATGGTDSHRTKPSRSRSSGGDSARADEREIIAPKLTVAIANQFAQLLAAGLDSHSSVGFIVPGLKDRARAALAKRWMNHRFTLAAVNRLNGGSWKDLPPDRRYAIALDKHRAQCAFFLNAFNFTHAVTANDLRKFEMARTVLEAALAADADEADPLKAFARGAEAILQKAAKQQAAADELRKAAEAEDPTPAQLREQDERLEAAEVDEDEPPPDPQVH